MPASRSGAGSTCIASLITKGLARALYTFIQLMIYIMVDILVAMRKYPHAASKGLIVNCKDKMYCILSFYSLAKVLLPKPVVIRRVMLKKLPNKYVNIINMLVN